MYTPSIGVYLLAVQSMVKRFKVLSAHPHSLLSTLRHDYNCLLRVTSFDSLQLTQTMDVDEEYDDRSGAAAGVYDDEEGRKVIPSALSNTLCADLGVERVLKKLNAMLGTSWTLDSVLSVLNPYVAQGFDFGTTYAYLRPFWDDIHTIEHRLRTRADEDKEMRRNVLADGKITTAIVPPRRVWDIYANRVVPYWVALSLGREMDRMSIMSPINGSEWPVPMPKDGSLDLVRIEMLNVGAEYAWLDILRLRQEGGRGEHLRTEEWKLDVPTIGTMYDWDPVVCYFNGLGQPLHLTPSYFESDRCWFRRAWTLHESPKTRLLRCGIVSTKPLDKVAGLVYLLRTDSIPIYDAEQSQADAWEVLMDVMAPGFRAEFFFFYPQRRGWKQVLATVMATRQVSRREETDVDCYMGYRIESTKVRSLGEVPTEGVPRRGELVLEDGTGVPQTVKIVADHTYPIPDGSYTLICCDADGELPTDIWVVGRLREDGTLEKFSVFSSAEDEEVNVRKLGFEQVNTVLC
ncbi:hypothetical protein EV421DRAFT_2017216 [Armillaria borealis]|uniref:Heterokaryon incompatibility domain-containing protein n=1 Tax=Armillaria borealis TaxID=47425 RepID=A0AA39MVI2_9AGAR|nr:hypothetical protein EV421DRAFT_2017216 [Armillaria borealis]